MKSHQFIKLSWVVAVLSFAVLISLSACENKSGQGVNAGNGIYGGGPLPQNLLLGGVKSYNAEDGIKKLEDKIDPEMLVNVMVQDNGYLSWYGAKASVFYSGPVAIVGTLEIPKVDLLTCFAPVGVYNVTTIQAGYMAFQTLNNVRVDAVGPGGARIIMTLIRGILTNPNGVSSADPQGNRMGMTLRLESINGAACGGLISI
jgi:hypothetical protein